MSSDMPNAESHNPWTHRYCVLVGICTLLAVAAGAVITSLERPIAITPATIANPSAATFEFWHQILGAFACVLTIGLAVWLMLAKSNKQVTQYGWIAVAAGLAEAGLGASAILQALPPLADILHALLGPTFFSAIVAIAVMTSASWQRGPERIDDSWRPSMRSLALAMPAIVLLQIMLGAAYRYRALGVLWHILNAMLVLLLILIVAVFLVRQFPEHPTLRPFAVGLAIITSIQVLLGFTTFMMLILFPETSLAVVITSVLHVVNGSLTLGASVALAIQIRYNLKADGHIPDSDRQVT
jgi:heme A synthase